MRRGYSPGCAGDIDHGSGAGDQSFAIAFQDALGDRIATAEIISVDNKGTLLIR
jgi:hypothetical protein